MVYWKSKLNTSDWHSIVIKTFVGNSHFIKLFPLDQQDGQIFYTSTFPLVRFLDGWFLQSNLTTVTLSLSFSLSFFAEAPASNMAHWLISSVVIHFLRSSRIILDLSAAFDNVNHVYEIHSPSRVTINCGLFWNIRTACQWHQEGAGKSRSKHPQLPRSVTTADPAGDAPAGCSCMYHVR